MSKERNMNLFEQYLFEAPGDDPTPDIPDDSTPPDMPEDTPAEDGTEDAPTDDGGMPDISTDDEPPPDMDDGGFGDTDEDMGYGDDDLDINGESDTNNMGLDEKVSAIMNMNLYKRFLSMLTTLSTQQASIKNSGDIIYAISPQITEISKSLKKLEENIRLYLKNNFLNENYSKNLLFFNKCINLLKLLDDSFDSIVRKGVKERN